MSYLDLVEPGVAPSGQVAFHVPGDLDEHVVVKPGYRILRQHGEAELVAGTWSVGVMTMARLLPVLLSLDGDRYATRGDGFAGPGRRLEVTRCRCPVCGTTAYVLGEAVVACRTPGHGPTEPLPAEVTR